MEKIRCEVCGRPAVAFIHLCKECIDKARTKGKVKIGQKTLDEIEELDKALEIMEQGGLDPEGGKLNGE